MSMRPPSFSKLKPRWKYYTALQSSQTTMRYDNITQPLSRAAMVAEGRFKDNAKPGGSSRAFSTLSLIPRKIFPRPKRNVLFSSSWYRGYGAARGGAASIAGVQWAASSSMMISSRSFSTAKNGLRKRTSSLHKRFFLAEARKKRQQRRRFIRWWTVTSLTVVLGGVAAKIRYERYGSEGEEPNEYAIKPHSWHLYAYSTLPLKAISRLWGKINSIDLPVWLRSPLYRLYLVLFGVNLDEMAEPDLTTYPNLSEFFYRQLKPGIRPIADSDVVSPADGKVLKFGVIQNGEIEQVKGMTYSIDALLGLNTTKTKLGAPVHSLEFEKNHRHHDESEVLQRDEEFAKINGISYTMDDILGDTSDGGASKYHFQDLEYKDNGDGTAKGAELSISKEMSVAKKIAAPSPSAATKNNSLFFAVIYLAPGDYHRYHSPTNWVSTLRRHFIGELFSVAPFFQKTLQGLFVLNERVALLGYWKYGFFSMIPVGATNVGSIIVNFDKDLKTNDVYEHEIYSKSASLSDDESSPLLSSVSSASSSTKGTSAEAKKRLKKNTVYEATYTNASRLLGGYPLSKGQEVGGFKLGLTVVLVFEAPENFQFNLENGQKVKMGQSLGGFV